MSQGARGSVRESISKIKMERTRGRHPVLALSSVSSVTQPSRRELQVLTSATAEKKKPNTASLCYPPSQSLPPVCKWDLATSSFIMLKGEPGSVVPKFEKSGLYPQTYLKTGGA